MGVGLLKAFEQSVLSNAESALKNQILLLMANIEVEGKQVRVPQVLSEAHLSQADSNLFAQINTPNEGVIWQSPSLLDAGLPSLNHEMGEFLFHQAPKVGDGLGWMVIPTLYAMTFAAEWESDAGDVPFSITVAEHRFAYAKRLRDYREQVFIWLGVLGAMLLALLLALFSWVLKPLGRVVAQVGEIENGTRQRFDEDYPEEVSSLTQNLNQLLNFEEQRINRQKDVLGNLAHSLKTPIAVLKGLSYSDENKSEADTQLSAMQQIIDYQLQAASAVGRRRFAKPIEVEIPTQQIVNSLQKLYADKGLTVNVSCEPNVLFFGDQGDYMELAGNLLDNACKWATQSVSIKITNQELTQHRSAIVIEVADDGKGIDQVLKDTILQRGVRLDSQTPGHGLGLHIVKGIVEAYDGELEIRTNQPQGTVFRAVLN
jgi:two-component system sensor histidine kinase PhoQ